ncbi:MAG: alpha/beta hydrolase [Gemmatimonadaceae bacterium]
MHLPATMIVDAERLSSDGRELQLRLALRSSDVPGLLMLPPGVGGVTAVPRDTEPAGASAADGAGDADVRVPGVLLLHGYASRKELMAGSVGVVLQRSGMASLSIDLPLHGDRESPIQEQAMRNPLQLLRQWRQALAESAQSLRLLGDVPGVDRGRLALLGYSMGAYVAVLVAAGEPAARALVLAAGGDLPERTPLSRLVRRVADPLSAVRRLHGRPLLMLHGRHDRTVLPAQAERLFAAAGQPKTLRWWDSGHVLPPAAVTEAAGWLLTVLGVSRQMGRA